MFYRSVGLVFRPRFQILLAPAKICLFAKSLKKVVPLYLFPANPFLAQWVWGGGKSDLNPYLTRVLETMPHHKIGPP